MTDFFSLLRTSFLFLLFHITATLHSNFVDQVFFLFVHLSLFVSSQNSFLHTLSPCLYIFLGRGRDIYKREFTVVWGVKNWNRNGWKSKDWRANFLWLRVDYGHVFGLYFGVDSRDQKMISRSKIIVGMLMSKVHAFSWF